MCLSKVSFRSKEKAQAVAAMHSQKVYECPICFCWHCTSKENWRNEYVDYQWHKKEMSEIERKLRTEYNALLAKKNRRISELDCQVKRLKMGYDDEQQPDQ